MQAKSESGSDFSERTERLAAHRGVKLSDLPPIIGVSASMFHAYRSGKNPISPKVWRKLEKAENECLPSPGLMEARLREDPVPYRANPQPPTPILSLELFGKMIETMQPSHLMELMDLCEKEMSAGNDSAAKLLHMLRPQLWARIRELEAIQKQQSHPSNTTKP